MKKVINFFIISLILFLLISCTSRSNIIKKINSEVQSSAKFVSVSVGKIRDRIHGVYIIKDGDKFLEVMPCFKGISKDTNLNNAVDSIVVISCTMYDSEKGTYKSFFLFPDGRIKIIDDEKLPNDFFLHELSWENSPRGIAIIPEKIKLKVDKRINTDNSEWEIFSGKYDLSDEMYLSAFINALKGSLDLWYNMKDLNVVEVYRDEFEDWSIIRRFWLKEDIEIDFDQLDFKNLVNDFLYYYNKAHFEFFLEFK